MPAPVTRTKGTQFQIGDGAAVEAFLTVGRVHNVGEVKRTRETVDVTTHDSPGDSKEFISGLRDGGSVQIQYRVATDAGQAAIAAADDDGDPHNFRVVYPNAMGWTFSGIVTEYGVAESGVEGVLNGSATVKVSGVPAFGAIG